MPAVGGSIISVVLDGRYFAVAADAESNRKMGGWENEVQSNGDASARIIKTRVPLQIDGLALETDDSRGDQEYLQDLADLKVFFPLVITYASGLSYQGEAAITGEFAASSQNATTPVTLNGPGRLEKQ